MGTRGATRVTSVTGVLRLWRMRGKKGREASHNVGTCPSRLEGFQARSEWLPKMRSPRRAAMGDGRWASVTGSRQPR